MTGKYEHKGIAFDHSYEFWEKTYAQGNSSGAGSRGRVGRYKADFINQFVRENGIHTVMDFGCGDGQQNALFDVPHYVGLDVSETIIRRNRSLYADEITREFHHIDPAYRTVNLADFKAELTLSLDVFFHLIEDDVCAAYTNALFDHASRYVLVFSHDVPEGEEDATKAHHVRKRCLPAWVKSLREDFTLTGKAFDPEIRKFDDETRTDCVFFIFERT